MALISCNECNTQVSSNAESCPKCGNPIALAKVVKATGNHIKTVEETSKNLKLHTLLSLSTMVIGLIWLVYIKSNYQEIPSFAGIPFIMMVVSVLWYLITRIRIWWNHK